MDKRAVVVGWVSSSGEPSSRKTKGQCVRRTANNYSTSDRNDQEAYMRSRGIMLRGGWEEGGVDQHPGRRCFASSWRDGDKPTDRRTSKRATACPCIHRHRTSSFWAPPSWDPFQRPGRSADSRPRTPGHGALRGFLGSMRPFSGAVRSYSCRYPSQNTA